MKYALILLLLSLTGCIAWDNSSVIDYGRASYTLGCVDGTNTMAYVMKVQVRDQQKLREACEGLAKVRIQ
jgi:hypothetical protein